MDEFESSRLAALKYAAKLSYGNTTRQLREYFGDDKPVRQIRQQHAEAFIVSRRRVKTRKDAAKNKDLSSWARRRHVLHTSAIFQAAFEWGYLGSNPFKPAGRGSSPMRIRTTSRPWHHLTPDEFSRFVEQVSTAQKRAAFWLVYGSGMRPGEVYNLTVDKVDLDRRSIYIENRPASDDLPPFTVKSETQTDADKSRVAPIPVQAIPNITEAVKRSFRSGGFVTLTAERFAVVQRNWRLCRDGKPWGGVDRWKPWQNRDMVNNLLRDAKTYLRQSGVELTAPFDLKTLRKSYAQNLADNAVPPKTLAELLGDDVRVVMKHYNRVTDSNKAAAISTLDRLLGPDTRATKGQNAGWRHL